MAPHAEHLPPDESILRLISLKAASRLKAATCFSSPHATPPAPRSRIVTLDKLPREVLLAITEYLFASFVQDCRPWDSNEDEQYRTCPWYITAHRSEVWRDIANLASTCRRLYDVVTPTLYWLDARYNEASALLISSKIGAPSAAQKSLQAGARIDTIDMTEPTWEDSSDWMSGNDSRWDRAPINLTALHWAARRGHEQIVELLLDHGAGLGHTAQTAPEDKASLPINFTCRSFLYLIEQICSRSTWRQPPFTGLYVEYNANALYFALLESHTDFEQATGVARTVIAKRLVEAGSSLITHTGVGLHAMHQACADWNTEMVRWFLQEIGVDAGVTDTMGNTPLHHVALCYNYPASYDPGPVVRLLLQRGADINARNASGLTPLQVCFERTHCYQNDNRYSHYAYRVVIELVKGGACVPGNFSKACEMWPYMERDQVARIVGAAQVLGMAQELGKPAVSDEDREEKAFKTANQWVYGLANVGKPVPQDLESWPRERWRRYWLATIHEFCEFKTRHSSLR
ncbi:hypothetical protein FDECE_14753 [Fusarium decemcellulare]|nr:hypothetical protein FDECE_14753 [Fusarium decemcellulare]